MSFYDNSSLAFLPSSGAGKDGKAYSIKPTDGTGDFTFSRGSNLAATRVGPTGLIEKGRENLLTYSNDFTNAAWTKFGTITLTSGQSGYDGSSDAWLYESETSTHSMLQYVSGSSVYTYSVYAKAGTADGIRLRVDAATDTNIYVDLTDGSIITDDSGIAYKIESVGNGWYRLSITSNVSTLSNVRLIVTNNAGAQIAGNIYIQAAQLEISLAATEVIESGATTGKAGLLEDEPRFDYSGGATCPSLLLEPSRTQLLPQTEYLDGYSNVGSTDEPNAATSPEGLTNATFLKEDTSTGIHLLSQNTTASAGVYTASVFAKANGRDWLYLNIAASGSYAASFNLSNGTKGTIQSNITSATIEDYGNGWYRCSITADTTTPAVSPRIAIYMSTGDNVSSYTGDGTSGMYLYGFQIEQGSYPTSYIPNHSGGTITRGAETNIVEGISSVIGQTEGTLYGEVKFFETSVDSIISLSDGTNENRILFSKKNDNKYALYVQATTTQVNIETSGAFDLDSYHKFALIYKANDFKLYVDGTLELSATSGSVPVGMSQLEFYNPSGSSPFYGNAKQILVFPEALSDADCITLTT